MGIGFSGAPALRLLSVNALDAQIAVLEQLGPGRHPALARALDTLKLLREPSVNSTVTALAALHPKDQALVADVAIALGTAGVGRWKLAVVLRHAIEERS